MCEAPSRGSLTPRPPPVRIASTRIRHDIIMRISLAALLICGAFAAAACSDASTTPTAAIEPAVSLSATVDETPGLIGQARAATARFLGADAAFADGYLPMSPCVSIPTGAMG